MTNRQKARIVEAILAGERLCYVCCCPNDSLTSVLCHECMVSWREWRVKNHGKVMDCWIAWSEDRCRELGIEVPRSSYEHAKTLENMG